jgi:hypothetical protein
MTSEVRKAFNKFTLSVDAIKAGEFDEVGCSLDDAITSWIERVSAPESHVPMTVEITDKETGETITGKVTSISIGDRRLGFTF